MKTLSLSHALALSLLLLLPGCSGCLARIPGWAAASASSTPSTASAIAPLPPVAPIAPITGAPTGIPTPAPVPPPAPATIADWQWAAMDAIASARVRAATADKTDPAYTRFLAAIQDASAAVRVGDMAAALTAAFNALLDVPRPAPIAPAPAAPEPKPQSAAPGVEGGGWTVARREPGASASAPEVVLRPTAPKSAPAPDEELRLPPTAAIRVPTASPIARPAGAPIE